MSATERFVVIADAEMPHLMETTQSVGAFSEKIVPGSSMVLVSGLIALNFNPHFVYFNMTSNLQVVAYGDAVDKTSLPLLCGMADKNGNQSLPEFINVGKNKFFLKEIQGKIAVSSSGFLLRDLVSAYKPKKTKSDLVINFFPDKYLKLCPGSIAYLRAKFDKEIVGKNVDIPDNKSIEKLLHQCKKVRINVDARKSVIALKMTVNPVGDSDLARFLSTKAPGAIASGDITKLAKKISGSPDVNPTNSMSSVLTLILTHFFSPGNTDVFAKLCDIRISHDKSALFFNANISQSALYKALVSVNLIKKQNGDGI